jgi:GntR family transcriptional repressor for pyruvate dehydrogenase complex
VHSVLRGIPLIWVTPRMVSRLLFKKHLPLYLIWEKKQKRLDIILQKNYNVGCLTTDSLQLDNNMNHIKKIIKGSVSDQVFLQLKENVVKGIWRPGEKIPSENQLVSLFGVSRASIRMAIQRMITLGLLESRVGNGTYVRQFTPGTYINELVSLGLKPEDQLEIMEFRRALESEAIRLAAEKATDEDLRELEEIHLRARDAFKRLDQETYFKEDMQFHMQIFRMSKNSLFVTTVKTLADVLFSHFYSIVKDFFETSEVFPSDEADKHTVILKALKNRDAKAAVETYTSFSEDLIAMYHQLQSKEGTSSK